MRKKLLIIVSTILILLVIFLIMDYTKIPDDQTANNNVQENQLSNNTQIEENPYFIGRILEIHSETLIIEPDENQEIRKSSDKISARVDSSEKWKVGMTVIVVHTGYIMETYPAQIDVISIEEFQMDKFLSSYKDIKSLPEEYSIEDAITDRYFVVMYNGIYNDDLYNNFLKDVENKIQAFIRIVQPTVEGNIMITDIQYTENGKIQICHDSTRDKFASEKNRTYTYYTFSNIGTLKNSYGEYLYAFNGDELTEEMIENNECFEIAKIK